MPTSNDPEDRSTKGTRVAGHVTAWFGSFPAIVLAGMVVLVWLLGGLFVTGHFRNNTYQLLINTTTTIITFLMVFVIQNTQNRDGRAVQAKLDAQSEVLRAVATRLGIDDDEDLLTKLVGVEDAPDRTIRRDQHEVRKAVAARRDGHNGQSAR